MARRSVHVTSKKKHSQLLPQWAAQFAIIIELLAKKDILERIAQTFRLKRKPGYAGIDLFIFILAFFTYPEKVGIRTFAKRVSKDGQKLAALAGRASWPTSSSISRALKSISLEKAQEFTQWLLNETYDSSHVIHCPEAISTDTLGQRWHLFDYDPTVTAIRQRSLPQGEDLPEPRRRCTELAGPGYPGRKRGEVQYTRTPLQHAGSSLWLWQTLSPGNGHHVDELEGAVRSLSQFCTLNKVEIQRSVIRFDGGNGGVRTLVACRNQNVKYLTRIARYDLLNREPVAEYLKTARWQKVQDSGSGPQREAVELGTFILAAKKDRNCRIETRVVVSRYQAKPGKKGGSGKVIDGFHYELFATDLPADCWPASETVTTYYGRCGQENRYNQSERELDLDRTLSFNPGGQLVATSIGLFVWNLRVSLGAKLLGINQCPEESDETVPNGQETPDQEPGKAPPAAESDVSFEPDPGNGISSENKSSSKSEIMSWLSGLDWEDLLKKHPGFVWDAEAHVLKCPSDASLHYHDLIHQSNRSVAIRFRARRSSCFLCSTRARCTHSTSPYFQRDVRVSVNRTECPILKFNQNGNDGFAKGKHSHSRTKLNESPELWKVEEAKACGPYPVVWPLFLPSEVRHRFEDACRESEVEVDVLGEPSESKKPFWQRSKSSPGMNIRRSWNEVLFSNALGKKTRLRIRLRVSKSLIGVLKSSKTSSTILTLRNKT